MLASSAAVYGDVDGLPHTEDLVGARQSPTPTANGPTSRPSTASSARVEASRCASSTSTVRVNAARAQHRRHPHLREEDVRKKPQPCLVAARKQGISFTLTTSHVSLFASPLTRGAIPQGRVQRGHWEADEPPRTGANVGCGPSPRGLKGDHLTPLMGPARSGDLDHSMADLAAITADLGWRPTVSLDDGLGE